MLLLDLPSPSPTRPPREKKEKLCVPEAASTNWPLMKSLVNLMSSSGTSNPLAPFAAAIAIAPFSSSLPLASVERMSEDSCVCVRYGGTGFGRFKARKGGG